MSPESNIPPNMGRAKPPPSFRRAVLRGLAIVMPLLLTVLLFRGAWELLDKYFIDDVESLEVARIVWSSQDELSNVPEDATKTLEDGTLVKFEYNNRTYRFDARKKAWIGRFSEEYVREHKYNRSFVLTVFIPVFILLLYVLGKFVVAGIGRMLVSSFESLIHRIPLINKVYASVKQVTDFLFVEREIEFNRVVVVEYPRKGLWSIGFVTGESMLEIAAVANEPVLSVLMPTSPMPMTGFTITVRKSEAIDLNISVDEAIQFVVSCGVVVPIAQQHPTSKIQQRVAAAIQHQSGRIADDVTKNEEMPNELEVPDRQL